MDQSAPVIPMIYIEKDGVPMNVPVASLEHYIQWDNTEAEVRFREVYKDPSTGEIVKDSTHVLKKDGLQMGAEQEAIA